jgi:hypothetical protein
MRAMRAIAPCQQERARSPGVASQDRAIRAIQQDNASVHAVHGARRQRFGAHCAQLAARTRA